VTLTLIILSTEILSPERASCSEPTAGQSCGSSSLPKNQILTSSAFRHRFARRFYAFCRWKTRVYSFVQAMRHYTHPNLSEEAQNLLSGFFSMLAKLSETFV
jgi:hypothetical protein